MEFLIWLHRHESSQEISLFELSLGITSGTILCQTFPKIFCSSKALDKYLNLRFNDKVKVCSIMRFYQNKYCSIHETSWTHSTKPTNECDELGRPNLYKDEASCRHIEIVMALLVMP